VEQKLSHYDTLALQSVVEIGGDLLLLPEQSPQLIEEVRALRHGQTIAVGESLLVEANERYFPLSGEYRNYRAEYGKEPEWMAEKPLSVQRRLRLDWAILEENPLSILGVYPHTGLSYMVREGGLCEELMHAFKLFRLHGIKQLGFLQTPWFEDSLYPQPIAEHNRFVHSLDVMVIASVIGYNLGLDEVRFNTLRMAAFTHDMGTPAGGDSVKLVNPAAFDEDLNYPQLIGRFNWEHIRTKYKIEEELLIETILNRGLLGQILDIADKLAYVARDLHACDPYLHYGRDHYDQHGLHTILTLVERYPNVCGLWDAVSVHEGRMVITDAARLSAFLKVRTLMFRELYYHPNARFGEYLVSRVLVKSLYNSGRLTRERLLEMQDYELHMVLNEEFGTGRHHAAISSVVTEISAAGAQRKTFHQREEAEKFAESLRAGGNPFVLVEDNHRGIKTGAHFKVMTPQGPQSFAYAYPGEARELEEMATLFPSVHVYYLEKFPMISPEKIEMLAAAFRAAV
jgi:HD superfamily phosphohydrolase